MNPFSCARFGQCAPAPVKTTPVYSAPVATDVTAFNGCLLYRLSLTYNDDAQRISGVAVTTGLSFGGAVDAGTEYSDGKAGFEMFGIADFSAAVGQWANAGLQFDGGGGDSVMYGTGGEFGIGPDVGVGLVYSW